MAEPSDGLLMSQSKEGIVTNQESKAEQVGAVSQLVAICSAYPDPETFFELWKLQIGEYGVLVAPESILTWEDLKWFEKDPVRPKCWRITDKGRKVAKRQND